jgi:hypothetical protein
MDPPASFTLDFRPETAFLEQMHTLIKKSVEPRPTDLSTVKLWENATSTAIQKEIRDVHKKVGARWHKT